MPYRKGKKILSIWDLKARGDHRAKRIVEELKKTHPNKAVIYSPHKGTDILVVDSKTHEVIEAWEVTNLARFDYEGKPLYLKRERINDIITSLTKRDHWAYTVKWTASKDTKRYLAVSYLEQIPDEEFINLENATIEIIQFERQDFPMGYKTWDEDGKCRAFFWNGKEIMR